LSAEAQNLKMRLAEASEANAFLSAEAQNLKMSLAEAHSKDQADRDVIHSRLSELECELRSVYALLKEVSGLAAEKEERLLGQISSAEEVMVRCEVCLGEVMSAAGKIEGKLSSVKSDLEAKEGELSSAKSDLEAKEGELSSVKSDLEALSSHLASEKTRKKFSKEIMGLVDTSSGDLIEASKAIGDFEEENRRLMEEVMVLEAEKDYAQSRLEAESMKARSLMEQVSALRSSQSSTLQVSETQVAHGINGSSGADCEGTGGDTDLAADPTQDGAQVVLFPASKTPRDDPLPDRDPTPGSTGLETGLPQSEPVLRTPSPRGSPLSITTSPPSQIMDVSSSSAPLVISTPRDDPPETPGRLIVSFGMKGTPRATPETPRSITSSLPAMKGTAHNDVLDKNVVDKGSSLARQKQDWVASFDQISSLQILVRERDDERETAALQVMSHPFPLRE
jgi:regulator of replication initiation timing